MLAVCDQCRREFHRAAGQLNPTYRKREGMRNVYCSLRCSGLARRCGKTKAERVAEKRAYDEAYREKNRRVLAAKKAAWFQATYDPAEARRERKKLMWRHVLYCRRPEYKRQKVKYDIARRASAYGAYADAYLIYLKLAAKLRQLMPDPYERRKARGYYERHDRTAQQRRRNAQINRW